MSPLTKKCWKQSGVYRYFSYYPVKNVWKKVSNVFKNLKVDTNLWPILCHTTWLKLRPTVEQKSCLSIRISVKIPIYSRTTGSIAIWNLYCVWYLAWNLLHLNGWILYYLISVSSPWFLNDIETIPVPDEAAVRPVSVVKGEGSTHLWVAGVLNRDGVPTHGYHTVTSCIPLPLQKNTLNVLSTFIQRSSAFTVDNKAAHQLRDATNALHPSLALVNRQVMVWP